MQNLLYYLPLFGVLGLLYVAWKSAWVSRQDPGTDKMKKIAGHIAEGAMAFLKAEYKVLFVFILGVASLLALTANKDSHPIVGLSFILGAGCSILAALAVLTFALVATFIPINPAVAENTAPMINARQITQLEWISLPLTTCTVPE